jgi:hypothetical protein
VPAQHRSSAPDCCFASHSSWLLLCQPRCCFASHNFKLGVSPEQVCCLLGQRGCPWCWVLELVGLWWEAIVVKVQVRLGGGGELGLRLLG